MKLLELRLKNLNALYGQWHLDFTLPEYDRDSIFVITGPTGAGKSTILDAACLALYGRTPRLKNISQKENEIMSRGQGDCFAEVVFETVNGRFRVHWSQRRAHLKPDGRLVISQHEISNADSGKILASKKRDTLACVIRETGMDFDRFTRSILLAQGGFAAFLQATPDERSPILEQMTGTGIYSRISKKVHERLKLEDEQVRLLEAQMGGIELLEESAETALKEEITTEIARETQLTGKLKDVEEAIAWLDSVDQAQKALVQLEKAQGELTAELKQFEPEFRRLETARAALDLETGYAGLREYRRQKKENTRAMEAIQTRLPGLEKEMSVSLVILETEEKKTDQAKETLKMQRGLIRKVLGMDLEIRQKHQAVKEIKEAREACQNRVEKERRLQSEADENLLRIEKEKKKTEEYIAANRQDQFLAEKLGLIQSLFSQSVPAREKYEKNRALAGKVRKELAERFPDIPENSSPEAYRGKYERLVKQAVFQKKVQDLETLRSQLTDGTACPLCGATDHPFAHGQAPKADSLEQQMQTLNQLIHLLEKKSRCEAQERDAGAALSRIESDLEKTLAPFEKSENCQKSVKERYKLIEKQASAYRQREKQAGDLEKEHTRLFSAKEMRQEIIDSLTSELNQVSKALAGQEKTLAEQVAQRRAMYGEKDPEKEETALENALEHAFLAEKKIRSRVQEIRQMLSTDQARLKDIEAAGKMLEPDLAASENSFAAALTAAGFETEAVFEQARLSPEERKRLESRAAALDEKKQSLAARIKDRREALEKASRNPRTDLKKEMLQGEQVALKKLLKALGEHLGALKQKLADNQAARQKLAQHLEKVQARKKERGRWAQLHHLIGSADGKKYRNFAQGITFELMVAHANEALEKMSDRYLLVRDLKSPLDLNIMDDYQAGEIRSTKNLSGGESFIVSLALALGLSKMAGGKTRVDSLFLDEGFGTLDEETLETALQSLAGLQRTGKLIGIISHVPALKDRIPVQIQVQPISGGRSRIFGPGCSRENLH